MKYTKQQAERLKNEGINGYTCHNRPLPDVIIKDGFYIVESKMNKHTFSNLDNDKYKNFSVTKPKQAERMYSEEEVLTILHKRDMYKWEDHKEILSLTQWFEQFKKK